MTTDGQIDVSGFTPTQLKLWRVLEDGDAHAAAELLSAMEDTQAEFRTVAVHISAMRKKLRPQMHSILADYSETNNGKRVYEYRIVRLVTNRV